jgi:glycosyltransferase involved in cell wall biosynthesis
MNIDFIITHLSHGSPGSFYRPYELLKELINQGNNGRFFTPFVQDVNTIDDVHMELIPNITSKYIPQNFVYNNLRKILYSKTISKFVSYDKFLISSAKKIEDSLRNNLHNPPDIIQAEQEVAGLACLNLSKKLKIPLVIDFHNIWAEELVSMGYIKRDSKQFKNLIQIDKKIIENADGVIVVSDYMKEYFITKFQVDKNKICIIPPGGKKLYQNIEEINSIRFKSKKIIYSGLVNPREHVDLYVKSIPYVKKKNPKTQFLLSDKGESLKEIKNLCNSLKINPTFTWHESLEKARDVLKLSYLGVLPSKDDIPRKLGTPLKLFEYMSNGIPIIANNVGSWCDIIEKYQIGVLTDDDPQNFGNKINSVIEDEELYLTMQQNISKLLKEKFSWENHVKSLLIPFYDKIR